MFKYVRSHEVPRIEVGKLLSPCVAESQLHHTLPSQLVHFLNQLHHVLITAPEIRGVPAAGCDQQKSVKYFGVQPGRIPQRLT